MGMKTRLSDPEAVRKKGLKTRFCRYSTEADVLLAEEGK